MILLEYLVTWRFSLKPEVFILKTLSLQIHEYSAETQSLLQVYNGVLSVTELAIQYGVYYK